MQNHCRTLGLALHQFNWSKAAEKAGLKRNACYVIRPDGYIGLVIPAQDPTTLNSYIQRFSLIFGTANDVGLTS